MRHPKQIINSINYLNYFISFFFETKSLETRLINKIKFLFNIKNKIKLLGRARSGIYLAVKISLIKSQSKIVLMSPFTIPEVIDLVISAGGKPMFIDHETKSTNFSFEKLEKSMRLRPASVIITHYHINQIYYKKINKLCKKNNVVLIEDCAISYSGKSNNIYIGSKGDFAVYSFSSFKFINFFFGGAISFKNKYKKNILDETYNWKKLKSSQYLKKCLQTLKFEIYTNKYIFNFFTFTILKVFRNNKSLYLNKKSYLQDNFKLDKTYFSLPSNNAIAEIYKKTSAYKNNLRQRQRISKIYFKYLKEISIINIKESKKIFDDNEFVHFLIFAKNLKHKEYLIKKLLNSGFYVGSFFYANCAKMKRFNRYGSVKKINELSNTLITLPTHKRITINYAKNLSKKIMQIY